MESISLIIPALNEEEAIPGTLTRAVSDLKQIAEELPDIEFCEVILVDDGSTDRTRALALEVPGVRIVSYPKNRGYGLAIETGFAAARGTLLSFMDADGTCNPAFLRQLWERMKETGANVVIGNRLHAKSEMPATRRVGNTLYAWLLSAISGTRVRDTASGMRLIRRSALERLRPLPAGLSYTPAMSARCVLDPELKIEDIDMPYSERQGESKLHVVKDGLRFLEVILTTAVFYTPLRIFGGAAILWLVIAAGMAGCNLLIGDHVMAHPWLVVLPAGICGLMAAIGCIFHIFSKRIIPEWPTTRVEHMIARLLRIRYVLSGGMLFGILGCVMLLIPVKGSLPWMQVATGFLFYGASLSILVAVGIFIVKHMDSRKGGKLAGDHLLDGLEIQETTASS